VIWRLLAGVRLIGIGLLIVWSGQIGAEEGFSFKTLLMPGSVIEGHAEFEKECGKCHETFQDVSQTTLCLDCHEEVADDIKQTLGYHGRLSSFGSAAAKNESAKDSQCRDCHSEHLGRKGDIVKLDKDGFDHKQTDFELLGEHIGVQCLSCHKPDKKFREAPGQCFDCHESDDRHQGAFETQCQDCHSTKGWEFAKFDHDETEFALKGKHQETQCNACHPDERYTDTPTSCNSCHVLNDVHKGANGNQCEQCHQETAWDKIIFDHNKDTEFALTGEHSKQSCSACHKSSGFDDKPGSACIDCHRNDDEHNGRNGEQCDSCHQTSRWGSVDFDHARDTEFTLRGKHADLTCESCHRESTKGSELSMLCIDCHKVDDVHKGQQGRQCDSCHNNNSWRDNVRFNHDITSFPLVGMHAVASCESCHTTKQFRDAPNQCVDCHKEDDAHERTLGTSCADCHNPNDWKLWIFDHNTQTDFLLDGSHEGLSCMDCHNKPVATKIKQSSACVACHLRDDVHNRRFGRSCERCHITDSFREVRMQ
jgi:Cytochrome c7 and related cytochrome c